MLPERTNILPEAIIGMVLFVLFYVVTWYVVKPSFSKIENQVHYLNSEEYFKLANEYIVLEDVELSENVPFVLTLGELKSKGYIGEDDEAEEFGYASFFSHAKDYYSDDSRIIIVKKDGRYQYSIRLCPYSETSCDRNSETLLDTTK